MLGQDSTQANSLIQGLRKSNKPAVLVHARLLKMETLLGPIFLIVFYFTIISNL